MDQPELTGGYLFDIQGFSLHDGPGCRTLIFLKGCSLRCRWCSNPEGIHPLPEPLYHPSKCTFDRLCIEVCPAKAITLDGDSLKINRTLCHTCRSYGCEKACCSSAMRIGGYFITTDELLKTIRRDRHYWGSRGGITLTGGEPFLQPDFSENILKRCFDSYIHTAVETCGNVPFSNMKRSLPYTDWIFFDLKNMDEEKHRVATGSGVGLILENAAKLSKQFKGRLLFRIPLIPGFNDDAENIRNTSLFLHHIGKEEINILPVHHLGREKYNLLGLKYYTSEFASPTNEQMAGIQSLFAECGIRCYIGSETPF